MDHSRGRGRGGRSCGRGRGRAVAVAAVVAVGNGNMWSLYVWSLRCGNICSTKFEKVHLIRYGLYLSVPVTDCTLYGSTNHLK